MSDRISLWMRHETKAHETRAPLTPDGCKDLIETGRFRVVVERSPGRVFADEHYEKAGAQLVDTGAWRTLQKTDGLLIVGLEELENYDSLTVLNDHLLFAHAFDPGSRGARHVLASWRRGAARGHPPPPMLFDYEHLTDSAGHNVGAAMSWPAGFVGAAHGIRHWYHRQLRNEHGNLLKQPGPPLQLADSCTNLLPSINQLAAQTGSPPPRVLVVGAHGRAGHGAVDACEGLSVEVVAWDLPQTNEGGPFPEILEYDIVINAVALAGNLVEPFLTDETIDSFGAQRRLSLLVDVSCDVGHQSNIFPIYERKTSLEDPVLRVREDPPLEVIAIDNFPSCVGREASTLFSARLVAALADYPDGVGWRSARAAFECALAAMP